MKAVITILILCALGTLAFAAGVAVPDPSTDPTGLVSAIVAAFAAKSFVVAGCLCVIGLVFLARKFFAEKLAGDRAGAIMALIGGLATAFATAAGTGKLTPSTIVDTLIVGVGLAAGAAGLRQLIRRIFWPAEGDPGVGL